MFEVVKYGGNSERSLRKNFKNSHRNRELILWLDVTAGKEKDCLRRAASLVPGERFTRRAKAALQSDVRRSSFAVCSPRRSRLMNRALVVALSVISIAALAAATRGAEQNDAKKRSEGAAASDHAALFDKLDANHDAFIAA